MRQSELFYKTLKEFPAEEKSVNAQLLIRAGYIKKVGAGIYDFLPLGFRVLKKIEAIIREEMEKINGQEVLMPALHPAELWQTTGRWDIYKDLYKLKDDDKDFALGPTHEETVVPLAKQFIRSWQDLPLYLFQIQTKFRKEKRAKSGLLRGKEFLMKDLYSFHADEKDLDNYYEIVKNVYLRIFRRTGLNTKTFLTFASGGTFCKYSHEFQTLTPAGEDLIYICEKCGQAVNREIKAETPKCPNCAGEHFREEKAIEVGNIFKLKTKFSEPFGLKFLDKDNQKKMVMMGCYGIGLSRLMGTAVEVFHDEKGIIWPKEIAPFAVHLLALGGQKVSREAGRVYQTLRKKEIEVLYDDREKSPGEKLVEADLIGIPVRLVISEKTLAQKSGEIKKRERKSGQLVKLSQLGQFLSKGKK